MSKRKPTDVAVLETDGVILPGLLDLHGHPEFNVFAAWEPPKLYANRYAWRRSKPYQALVRDPQNVLLTQVPPQDADPLRRGARPRRRRHRHPGSVGCEQRVLRAARAQHRPVGLRRPPCTVDDRPALGVVRAAELRGGHDAITAGDVNAFYLHLSEGRRGDAVSAKEFQHFLNLGGATPATNIIHGSALTADDLRTVAGLGCRLVWSPQSNLRLYGETTLAGEAIAAGMPVALGADWLPSGSTSLLAEMKVARRELARQGRPIAAADLVAMVTSVAARLAGLDDHLGSLAVGRPADLVVLERHHPDPYENVCLADPSWVELVCIGGDVTYGRADWFGQLSGAATGTTIEDLTAWGKPMRLDTGFQGGTDVPSLSAVRTALTAAYPAVGPIFA